MFPTMRTKTKPGRAAPTHPSATTSAFKGACCTLYLFLFMTGIALIASSIASARSHHRNGTTLLVTMFVFLFVALLLILAFIHTFWPDGLIFQRRALQRQLQMRDEEMARPVSVTDAEYEAMVPKPLAVKTKECVLGPMI